MTVGIPIAITGTPRLPWLIPSLWFPTPLPGTIPVSVSCMVQPSLFVLRAASASIVTTKSGFTSLTTPFIISRHSMPVWAITPGTRPHTLFTFSLLNAYLPYSFTIWRVINKLSTHLGPSASGVTFLFPSPTTSAAYIRLSQTAFTKLLSSLESSLVTAWQHSSSPSDSIAASIVTYFPLGRPVALTAFSESIVTTLTMIPLSSFFSEKFTPLISVFAFLRLSCVSSARSVLAHHLSADKSIHLPCMIFQNHIYVNFLQFFSKYVLTEQKGWHIIF